MHTRKVRRAARVAAFSGWSMAIFAACTLVGAAFGDVVSLVMGLALGAIAFNELRGGRMLGSFNPAGAKVLGWNQIVLAVVIVAYASWSIVATLRSPALSQVGSTGDPDLDQTIAGLQGVIAYGVYGTIAIVGGVVPLLTAWYYFTRARLVRSIVAQTSPWVLEAIRAAA